MLRGVLCTLFPELFLVYFSFEHAALSFSLVRLSSVAAHTGDLVVLPGSQIRESTSTSSGTDGFANGRR